MPDNKAVAGLKAANEISEEMLKLAQQWIPFGGLLVTTARNVARMMKARGEEVGPFEQEIAQVESARANVAGAVAEFKSRFGDTNLDPHLPE